MGDNGREPRCAVFLGAYGTGKTSLVESLLLACGAIERKGSVTQGTTVTDASPEAKAHEMSVETSVAHAAYLGDDWCFVDCPGSLEFAQEGYTAARVADIAVVVVDPDPARVMTAMPALRFLAAEGIPHILFVNKLDAATGTMRDLMESLQSIVERPVVLRQVPIRDGEQITGYVDLVSERAYRYQPGEPSALIQLPDSVQDREQEARNEMLETLADFDDALLEQLLEESVPSSDDIYDQLAKDLRHGQIVPVLLGAALQDHGVRRLLKALRHETPGYRAAIERQGLELGDGPALQVFKTYHLPHTGKISLARVWRGEVKDGATVDGHRVSGLYQMAGHTLNKVPAAGPGAVVGLGRMEEVRTGMVLGGTGPAPEPMPPLYGLSVTAKNRNDEVKLTGMLQRLMDEDPSLRLDHNPDTHEMILQGQGDIHLRVAVERLARQFNLDIATARPQVAYKETISKSVKQHSRHKRQTGGHGQFGDVHVDIRPLPRGEGIVFTDKIVGGAIPKQYIPSVEAGVRDYAIRGPLGFPMVDFTVNLYDGSFHTVDSSDMAFKTAGRLAMSEGAPKCGPVLLEPIAKVKISVPSEHTAKVQRLVTGRRGQLLGFDTKAGWTGWDEVEAHMPEAEIHDLVIELRSLSQGVGFFTTEFQHLQELTGRLADQVTQSRQETAAS